MSIENIYMRSPRPQQKSPVICDCELSLAIASTAGKGVSCCACRHIASCFTSRHKSSRILQARSQLRKNNLAGVMVGLCLYDARIRREPDASS